MIATVAERTESSAGGAAPEQFLIELMTGLWLSRAVYAAARLRLADIAGEEPLPVEEFARRTGTHPESLYRVMRALASAGVFTEHPGRRFSQTELSAALRSDAPGSMRYTAISELGDDHYAAWEELLHSVRTGETAFQKRFGMPVWRYYAENPETGRIFERSMTGLTQRIHRAILSAYPFQGFTCAMDVGGGEGGLLAAVLERNPDAAGILFDQPQVIAMASERPRGGAFARVTPVAGDFFESVPAGADLHMLKWIIHDWNDEASVRILRNCRRGIAPGGKLLLMEMVLPEANDGRVPKLLDLNMLVMTGGRERTEAEFAALLERSGFRLARVVATESPVCILEAEPV